MPHHSALRCVSAIRRNNAKPLISNGLRFIVTCLPTAALWVLFHVSRHTYASLQLELGTDIYTVQHLLNHKNVSTTQIYASHADPKTREAADRIRLTNVKMEMQENENINVNEETKRKKEKGKSKK